MRLIFTALSVAADNAAAAFNSAARFGDWNTKADMPLNCGFFMSVITLGASFMAGLGGDTFGYAGSFVPVRQPRLVPVTLVWRRVAGFIAHKGVHHHA